MSPTEQGRFCSSCQKAVIDFSTMSDSQIIAFFKQPQGSICRRLHHDQLNRYITLPTKRVPWIRYFFQFALPAFLLSLKANSQQKMGKIAPVVRKEYLKGDTIKTDTVISKAPLSKNEINKPLSECRIIMGGIGRVTKKELSKNTVSGTVVDKNGSPVSYASITLKNKPQCTVCDSFGKFKVVTNIEKKLVVINTYLPVVFQLDELQSKEVVVAATTNISCTKNMHAGEIVVVARPRAKAIPLITLIKDTVAKQIKLFPNPTAQNTYTTLQWKTLKSGDYLLQIVNNN